MIENNKIIKILEDANIQETIINQYKSELNRLNALISVVEKSGKEIQISKLESAKKNIKSYLDTVNSNPGGYANSYINNIRIQVDVIKNLALEILLTSDTFLEYVKDEKSRKEAINTLKKEKELTDKQTAKLTATLKNVEEVIEGKTNTIIASEIGKRVSELEFKKGESNKNEQSAQYWMKKRNVSFWVLICVLIVFFISFAILIFKYDISKERLYSISILKIAFVGLFYSQYYFAQKNYRIYADLLSKYRHLQLNAKILENYLLLEKVDDDLKKQLISKVTDLISSSVSSHHFKDTDSKGFVNNIIPVEKIMGEK